MMVVAILGHRFGLELAHFISCSYLALREVLEDLRTDSAKWYYHIPQSREGFHGAGWQGPISLPSLSPPPNGYAR